MWPKWKRDVERKIPSQKWLHLGRGLCVQAQGWGQGELYPDMINEPGTQEMEVTVPVPLPPARVMVSHWLLDRSSPSWGHIRQLLNYCWIRVPQTHGQLPQSLLALQPASASF